MKMDRLWRYDIEGTGIGASTVVTDEAIIFDYLNGQRTIEAVDFGGRRIWWRDFPPSTYEIFSTIGEFVWVSGDPLRCLSAADGSTIWERNLGWAYIVVGPTAEITVWLEEGLLVGLDPATGAELWRWPDARGEWRVDDRYLTTVTPDHHALLVARATNETILDVRLPADAGYFWLEKYCEPYWYLFFDAVRMCVRAPAEVQWQYPSTRRGYSSVFAEQFSLAISGEPRLIAYDLTSGQIAWQHDHPAERFCIAGTLLHCGYGRSLRVYELSAGELRFETKLKSSISSISARGDTIYLGLWGALEALCIKF